MTYELRPMRHEDVDHVASEHRRHFPDGFFARLGPRFLTAYTSTYVGAPDACAYVACAQGGICGFVVGTTHPEAHRAYVLRNHGPRLAMTGGAALALRPGLAWSFLRTRAGRYVKVLLSRHDQVEQEAPPPGGGPPAVLAHIVVSRPWRASGVGTALVDSFLADAASARCASVSLVTEAGDHGAATFYDRLGWNRLGEITTAEGRPLQQYEFPLAQHRSGSPAPRRSPPA